MDQPRILIVDDDSQICEFVAWGLADRGYEVVSAGNGRQALDRIASARPDAIILDMMMPIMDGWEFARAYRETPGPHAPIVVMTAYMDPQKIAREIGAEGCISKPFDLIMLTDILRQWLPEGELGSR